jgi:hypothetical protein
MLGNIATELLVLLILIESFQREINARNNCQQYEQDYQEGLRSLVELVGLENDEHSNDYRKIQNAGFDRLWNAPKHPAGGHQLF